MLFTEDFIEYISNNGNSDIKENVLLHEFAKTMILTICCNLSETDDGYECVFSDDLVDGFSKLDNIFYEFFKIGLFAIGGGAVSIPFLFDLSEKFNWFSKEELIDMIAISQATPGPIGVNMATFAGFNAANVFGGILATVSLVLPSVVIMILIAKMMDKYSCNIRVKDVLSGIRPVVLALILYVGFDLAKLVIAGNMEILLFVALLTMMRVWAKSPIYYLWLSAVLGVLVKIL